MTIAIMRRLTKSKKLENRVAVVSRSHGHRLRCAKRKGLESVSFVKTASCLSNKQDLIGLSGFELTRVILLLATSIRSLVLSEHLEQGLSASPRVFAQFGPAQNNEAFAKALVAGLGIATFSYLP